MTEVAVRVESERTGSAHSDPSEKFPQKAFPPRTVESSCRRLRKCCVSICLRAPRAPCEGSAAVLLEVVRLCTVAALTSVWVQRTGIKHGDVVVSSQFCTRNTHQPQWVEPNNPAQDNPPVLVPMAANLKLSAPKLDPANLKNIHAFISSSLDDGDWMRWDTSLLCN